MTFPGLKRKMEFHDFFRFSMTGYSLKAFTLLMQMNQDSVRRILYFLEFGKVIGICIKSHTIALE